MSLGRREFLKAGGLAALGALTTPAWAAAADDKRLRVAQIGTAHPHAAGKWETLQRRSDWFDCAGVWEPDAEERGRAERNPAYQGARWLTEREIFDARLDAVLVETELPDLLRYAHRALEAGWHVHIDKPPGADLAGLKAI